jgi:hypothetical protein
MKRFLRNVALFSFGLLACFVVLYAVNTITSIVNAPRIESEILIVGDSHTERSLDPSLFPSAQNISQGAEPYYVTYWKLKKLLPRSSVQTVLLGFSHHNLSAFNDKKLSDEQWAHELFNRVYTIAAIGSLHGIEVDRSVFYGSKFRNMCLYPKWKHDSYVGRYFNEDVSNLTNPEAPIARHYFMDGSNAGVSEAEIAFLDSIVALTARERIEIILVTSPVHDSYYERVPENFIAGFEEKKRELETSGIVVLDHSRLEFPDDEFYNTDHLNERGATRFSKLISEQIATSD